MLPHQENKLATIVASLANHVGTGGNRDVFVADNGKGHRKALKIPKISSVTDISSWQAYCAEQYKVRKVLYKINKGAFPIEIIEINSSNLSIFYKVLSDLKRKKENLSNNLKSLRQQISKSSEVKNLSRGEEQEYNRKLRELSFEIVKISNKIRLLDNLIVRSTKLFGDELNTNTQELDRKEWLQRKLPIVINTKTVTCALDDTDELAKLDLQQLYSVMMSVCRKAKRIDFAHSDLHPGNVLVVKDRVIFIDPKFIDSEVSKFMHYGRLSLQDSIKKYLFDMTKGIKILHKISATEIDYIASRFTEGKSKSYPTLPVAYDIYGFAMCMRVLVSAVKQKITSSSLDILPKFLICDEDIFEAELLEFINKFALFEDMTSADGRYKEIIENIGEGVESLFACY